MKKEAQELSVLAVIAVLADINIAVLAALAVLAMRVLCVKEAADNTLIAADVMHTFVVAAAIELQAELSKLSR